MGRRDKGAWLSLFFDEEKRRNQALAKESLQNVKEGTSNGQE